MKRMKALSLLSGGLDSILAAKIIKDLGIEVMGVNFYNGFCIENVHRQVRGPSSCYAPLKAGHSIEVPVELMNVADEYLRVVKYPEHGRGSAMNPCIDCRIFMLKEAKLLLEELGAEFVVTGEVLGQRPMSQHYRALMQIQEESSLGDRLLRPLSAKLLPDTLPVKKGWIDRDDLYDIKGRSRGRQLDLAKRYGVTAYSQPAGGCCLLTEKRFGDRLRDAFTHKGKEEMRIEDFEILKAGRHFRLSKTTKVIIGRDDHENRFLEQFEEGRWKIMILDHPGPLALVEGDPAEGEEVQSQLQLAVRLTARYSDGKDEDRVRAIIERDGKAQMVEAEPLDPDDEWIKKARI